MNWFQNITIITISFLMARILIDSGAYKYILTSMMRRRSNLSLISMILILSWGFSIFFSNSVVVLSLIPMIKKLLEDIPDAAQRETLSTPIALALIYGANIGGMASLTGAPLNIVFAGYIEYHSLPGFQSITFFSWLLVGIPATALLIAISIFILKRRFPALPPISITSTGEASDINSHHKRVLRYFWVNLSVLILLSAAQFLLKPQAILGRFNIVDLFFLFHLLSTLFVSFFLPRGEKTVIKFSKNLSFLLLYVLLFIPIACLETVRELISRITRMETYRIDRMERSLFSISNRMWRLLFKESLPSIRAENPHSHISLNRLIYDLPYLGLVFMGFILFLIYLLLRWGDNPLTAALDGHIIQLIRELSSNLFSTDVSPLVFMAIVCFIGVFLTEIVNNTTIVLVLAPIVLHISRQMGLNPLVSLLALTLSSSAAFMTPIATPVNAISFASFKGVSLKRMLSTGIWLNLISILWILVLCQILLVVF